jgi:hypothetical protein
MWHAIGRAEISFGGFGAGAGGSYLAGGDLNSIWLYGSMGATLGGALSRLLPCFPAGTPVLTPSGWQPIESLQPGDLVLSRDEQDVTAPVAPKPIQQTFIRHGELFALQFTAGGTGWRIRRPGAEGQEAGTPHFRLSSASNGSATPVGYRQPGPPRCPRAQYWRLFTKVHSVVSTIFRQSQCELVVQATTFLPCGNH